MGASNYAFWQIVKWTIVTDIKGYDNKTVSDETVKSYIKALEKLYVIEDIKA